VFKAQIRDEKKFSKSATVFEVGKSHHIFGRQQAKKVEPRFSHHKQTFGIPSEKRFCFLSNFAKRGERRITTVEKNKV